MVRGLCITLAVSVLTGCGSTTVLHVSSPADSDALRQANDRIGRRAVRLELRDGSVFRAKSTQIAGDSTRWFSGGSLRSAPSSQVRRVSFQDPWRGVLDGLLIGTMIGAPLGATRVEPCPGATDTRVTPGDRAYAAVYVAFAECVLSVPICVGFGHRVTYMIRP